MCLSIVTIITAFYCLYMPGLWECQDTLYINLSQCSAFLVRNNQPSILKYLILIYLALETVNRNGKEAISI